MKNNIIPSTLKSLFDFSLPKEDCDGGEFIEDTKIYKFVSDALNKFKPTNSAKIDSFCFDFAIKTAAIELYQGSNHGFYNAESYSHLFEDQFTYFNIDDLVVFCSYYGFLEGFGASNLDFDYDNELVKNKKTKEIISFDNIKGLALKLIEYQLTSQINIVKAVLLCEENKGKLIKLIAGKDKEEYIESATALVNDLMQL